MQNQIEVEFIGALPKERFEQLKTLFAKKGTLKKQKERLSFMYFRNNIPKDIAEIKEELVDLRFRITNKEPEIVLKYGTFSGSHARKEITIPLQPNDVSNHIEFLNLLGWNLGVIYATKTFVYIHNGIEFSLIEIKDYGYNFEAEILTNEENVTEAKTRIQQELTKLGLIPFDEQKLNIQCNAINNKKDLQFDFSKQSFKNVQERFKEFF